METEIELNVKPTLEICDEDLEDILITAFEGGINYWCDECEIIGKPKANNAIEHLINGGEIRLHLEDENDLEYENDFEDEDMWQVLEKGDLIRGIRRCLEEDYADSLGIVSGEMPFMHIDTGNVDSAIADGIVQYAIFGEPIYG